MVTGAHRAFYTDSGELNSGPRVCRTPTEPSFQPLKFLKQSYNTLTKYELLIYPVAADKGLANIIPAFSLQRCCFTGCGFLVICLSFLSSDFFFHSEILTSLIQEHRGPQPLQSLALETRTTHLPPAGLRVGVLTQESSSKYQLVNPPMLPSPQTLSVRLGSAFWATKLLCGGVISSRTVLPLRRVRNSLPLFKIRKVKRAFQKLWGAKKSLLGWCLLWTRVFHSSQSVAVLCLTCFLWVICSVL